MKSSRELFSFDGGVLRLHLHPGQTQAWLSARRFILVLAGTQGGKTSFGPWWIWREIQKRGRGDYLAVTTSYPLFMLKMLPEMQKVFERILGIGRLWSGAGIIEIKDPATGKFLANGVHDQMYARIILRSAASPSGLEAATANAAWLDECGQDDWDVSIWEAVLRRLSIQQGRVLGTTTVYNMGWLRNEWYKRWADGDPLYDVVQFDSIVNPSFPVEEYERAKSTMQDWRFQMFYRGRFARPVGLVYADFDDDMLCNPFPVPHGWEKYVGVDFGGANTATVWCAIDPKDGTVYAYHETLEGGLSSREHVEKAMFKHPGNVDEINFYGGSPSETQFRKDWTDSGVYVQQPPFADVESGIGRVVELMRLNKFRVFKGLAGIKHELGTYRRKLDDTGMPTDVIADKNSFHRLDALRYAVSGMTERGSWDTSGYGVVEDYRNPYR